MNEGFPSQSHGGRAAWQLHDVLDLSVNVNPYGPPAELLELLRETPVHEYPDPTARALRDLLAQRYDSGPEHFLVGNGANELLWAAARSMLRPGLSFTSVEPCYSEFTRAALSCGATPVPLRLAPDSYARDGATRLREHLKQYSPAVVYLCNPNSPSGGFIDEVLDLALSFPQQHFVLDESFLSLSSHHNRASLRYPNHVLRIVSLTKDGALAGLRIGYAYGSRDRMESMQTQIPTWSVNALALVAGQWCLQHPEYIASSRERMLEDAAALHLGLEARGLRPVPSTTVFTMFAPKDAAQRAADLLHRHRILVRGCSSYGWPEWWRVAARPAPERQRFFRALDEVLS